MLRNLLSAILFFVGLCAAYSQNQAPLIQNFIVSANWTSQQLLITYDVTDAEGDMLDIALQFSDNQGATYLLSPALAPATGDIGYPIAPGPGKTIQADLSMLAAFPGNTFTVRLVADDRQPFDPAVLVAQVDSNRMRNDLLFVEGVRHHGAGPAHLVAVRDSMKEVFSEGNLYVGQQNFTSGAFTAWNVWGNHAGTVAADTIVIIDAHYDTVNNAPGADDNGSGVVAVMEAARLLSQYPCRKTLRFMGFDLEESGLVGSKKYIGTVLPASDKIAGVLNFEMIGYYSEQPNSQTLPGGFNLLFPAAYAQVANNAFKGDFITNVSNVNSGALADLFANTTAQFVPALKVVTVKAPGNSEIAQDLRRSDHAAFWDAGHKALMLTDGANFRNACYHTPQDTFDNKLNMTFMSNVTAATIATAAVLAGVQHADWVRADFAVPSAVNDPNACGMHAYAVAGQYQTIYLNAADCPESDWALELYDGRGIRVAQTTLRLSGTSILRWDLSQTLTPGWYVLKMRSGADNRVEKVIVR